jgi:hypothetical protein
MRANTKERIKELIAEHEAHPVPGHESWKHELHLIEALFGLIKLFTRKEVDAMLYEIFTEIQKATGESPEPDKKKKK